MIELTSANNHHNDHCNKKKDHLDDHHHDNLNRKNHLDDHYNMKDWPFCCNGIDVIGVPFNFGQPKAGVEKGPQSLRDHGLIKQLENVGIPIEDKGDLKFENLGNEVFSNVRKSKSVGAANKQISMAVTKSVSKNKFCLVLGGDHTLAIGSISGQAAVSPDLGVIWVDAHADINPPLASNSGNCHGMPLSFLVRELTEYIPKELPGFEWVKPCLNASDIVYIGLRDVDIAERIIIDKYKIKYFMMADIVNSGIKKVMDESIEYLSSKNPERPLHLSFDIDGLDPRDASSTGTPVPGGLLLREGMYIAERVAKTGRLQVFDMAEVNPDLGTAAEQKRTLQSACGVIGACFSRDNIGVYPADFVIPKP